MSTLRQAAEAMVDEYDRGFSTRDSLNFAINKLRAALDEPDATAELVKACRSLLEAGGALTYAQSIDGTLSSANKAKWSAAMQVAFAAIAKAKASESTT